MHATTIEGPDADGEFGWRCTNQHCTYSANGFSATAVAEAAAEHTTTGR